MQYHFRVESMSSGCFSPEINAEVYPMPSMLKKIAHFVFGPHTFEVVALFLAGLGVGFGLASDKEDIVKAH